MVPMDQPAAALDMITRFVRHKDLAGHEPAPATSEREKAKQLQQQEKSKEQQQALLQPAAVAEGKTEVY